MIRRQPTVFIGASTEGLPFAYDVQESLDYDAEVVVWTQGIFELSSITVDDLAKALRQSDFGIFLLTPDDVSAIRGKTLSVARDNVLFELGMFIAGLGRERTFFICPSSDKFHLPSDLIGITPAIFDFKRARPNRIAALGSTCNKIRRKMQALGPRPSPDVPNSATELHEGRVPVSKTVQLLQTAKSHVSVTGVSLRSFVGYFERVSSHNFRGPIVELLKRGVKFDFNVLDPDCKCASVYAAEHGSYVIEQIRESMHLFQEFAAEQSKFKRQIRVARYTRLPFAYILLVDPLAKNGSGLVASYLPLDAKADSPYLEIYRKEYPVAFQKYVDAVMKLTLPARNRRTRHS